MSFNSARRGVVAVILLVAFASQATRTLAGTTGGLSGTVLDAASGAPIAGARVQITSPSDAATGTTDAGGHFTFLTLAPDTYTVSVSKNGYQQTSVPGQTVFADSVQTVNVRLAAQLQTIAHVSSTAAGSLVKSGTTADVYSVNPSTQRAAAALGGGGSLNSAYSAIATAPGAYVIPNQTGYYQTVHIRGGDYDQAGYEFDGVPVNRSFDNYPSSSASSLGNAEVQVYTGATPANSEGEGLAGFINQVIKTGTYPGSAEAFLGIGTPTFYHRAAVEIGGASPDRLFSYYVGVGGYNQDFRYVNDQNGANYDDLAGIPLAPQPCANPDACPWAGGVFYALGPMNYEDLASVSSRDVIANVHLAIPHRFDAGRDDVQVLWDSSALKNSFYSSTNDIASPSCGGAAAASGTACAVAIGLGQPVYFDGYQWNCQSAVGQTFTEGQLNAKGPGCTSNYYFPSSQNRTAPNQPIPVDARDQQVNNQEIEKIQYTKNFGSTAFLRVYGYSYYSDWLQNAPQSSYADYVSCCPGDYELSSHTRGVSLNFQDQVNAQNLLNAQAAYVTASTIRDNNTQFFNFTTARQYAAVAVNAADPYGGYCYGPGSSAPQSCSPGNASTTFATWAQLQTGSAPALPTTCVDPHVTSTKCTYLLAENSQWATFNSVVPKFFNASLTDELRPSDKWLFNLGVRLDSYTFDGSDTDDGPARQFWYNAYNLDTCVNDLSVGGGAFPAAGGPGKPFANPGGPGAACPTGSHAANLQNISGQSFTYNIYEPRFSGTYTVNPNSVIRFSYGRYSEAPNAAYEQYNTLEEDEPFGLLGPNLLQYGRTSPGLPIYPPTSLNYDLSFEHRFPGTDLSFKVTPFLRQTQDQVQIFYLNQQTGFVSGLNVGSQRSQGVEFQAQKGDFARNGFSGLLSFAYTNSYIKYGLLNNGASIISPINSAIADYNAYTGACAPGGSFHGKSQYGQALCGSTTTGVAAAPCYTTGGAPVTHCTAADVGNPYWNDAQSLINPGQNFATYNPFPQGIGSSAAAYGAPYVATLLLNYKHDRFAITPTLQFQGGSRYGAPLSNVGVDPAACTAVLPIAGANGGSRYNAANCGVLTSGAPDVFTGTFDDLGSFVQPNEFIASMQLSYDVSPRVTLVAVAANLVNTCWGGTQAPWTYGDHNVCSYGVNASSSAILPLGNAYNPPGYAQSILQPIVKYPYAPAFGPYNDNSPDTNSNSPKSPFDFFITANIKL